MNLSPCKDCEKRHPHCHSECEEYAAYREDRDKVNAERQKESAYKDIQSRMMYSMKKGVNHNPSLKHIKR